MTRALGAFPLKAGSLAPFSAGGHRDVSHPIGHVRQFGPFFYKMAAPLKQAAIHNFPRTYT